MLRRTFFFLAALLICASAASAQPAALKLPAIFGDNMVLQRGIPVPVWGWAQPGQTVSVSLLQQNKSAVADHDGRWSLKLDPLKEGGPYELVISAGTRLTLKNVLVGEVWVCSGQSNMEWPLQRTQSAERAIAEANYPSIRLFTVKRNPAEIPQTDVQGQWEPCAPEGARSFSAVAYYFGRELHKALGVPVGLIHTSWGGTSIHVWTRREVMEADPVWNGFFDAYESQLAEYERRREAYPALLEQHQAAVARAKEQGESEPAAPAPPRPPGIPPAGLYNGMIAPIIPYAIAGATWYQGESNAGNAIGYRKQLPQMIENWRQDWNQPDFPFLIVQLANFRPRLPEPGESAWAELREAQLLTTQTVPRTGLAVTIDIGEADDIHPQNKEDVGKRLALAALAIAYGKDIVRSGPIYDSMSIEGNKARLRFKHTGGGLVAKGADSLKGFAIAGADRRFVWADAKTDGDTVLVWSDRVPQPVAVRYGWADNPEVNLYNTQGLPASPFRTDDWPRQR